MLAREKKPPTEGPEPVRKNRRGKVLTRAERTETPKDHSGGGVFLELRIVAEESIIHRLEKIAAEIGAGSIEELEIFSLPAAEVEKEFAGNAIGAILQGVRYREGLTQMALSRHTGIPQRHISEMENGKRVIGKVNARKLAEAMDVDYRIFL